jgi:hypothetical protein
MTLRSGHRDMHVHHNNKHASKYHHVLQLYFKKLSHNCCKQTDLMHPLSMHVQKNALWQDACWYCTSCVTVPMYVGVLTRPALHMR